MFTANTQVRKPLLKLVTVELPEALRGPLVDLLPESPTAFIRNGGGIIGFGEALRITATGPNRISTLAAKWREAVAAAEIEDSVNLPGTGMVAFGTIAFAETSEAESVLIVPQVLIGSRDGRMWLTSANDAKWPAKTPYRANAALTLKPGEQSREGFEAAVQSAIDAITAGKAEKVVLARDLVAPIDSHFDIRPVLATLAERYPSCWVYSVDGTFGASPELLVRVAHGQVSARVLAGTAGRGTDPAVDQAIAAALAGSTKNLAEHVFAVDSLVQALEPFCDHVDADSEPFSLALPNVWHLASDVHGVLKQDSSVLDLADALHPTAAVAGTPRLAAQLLIERLEPFDRGRYAGPVGWIGADGDGEWAIALRGGQVDALQVRAFAGCGIVAESEPAAELAETDLKFQPITGALA
jgi:menaquinone-specific isochorismate synthase